ncbi:hypothetical protein RSSM_04763 [Rhodopirellula sallentina SM41]|uniref:Uncharacterized protein n=1 Tax=Rhodopirellula sallentina SM41 TaxID=1263870 RepID=M5U7E8_9BACT|nr:hypothetical protein RSSM_04763 [Rhodopirellula sallentina SM41]
MGDVNLGRWAENLRSAHHPCQCVGLPNERDRDDAMRRGMSVCPRRFCQASFQVVDLVKDPAEWGSFSRSTTVYWINKLRWNASIPTQRGFRVES